MEFNSIGLIDGQHRVFSYHEGGFREKEMTILRKQQNLLVTGIIFPQNMGSDRRTQFEARLFLDINSNQTNAKSDLKQEIGLLLKPYSAVSIAKRVVNHLNDDAGPLHDQFERYFFDKDKLKTTTVVSYGLRPLVRIGGEESLFRKWRGSGKTDIEKGANDAALAEYILFAVNEINLFLSASKAHFPKERWTPDKKQVRAVLNTTFVNGLISCFRRLVAANKLRKFNWYRDALAGIEEFDSSTYKSSQYNALGEKLYETFFAKR